MTQPTPAPGWYPDPAGGPGQRYWDGAVWRDAAPAAPNPYPAAPAAPAAKKRKLWPWLVGGLVVLLALAAMGGKGSKDTPSVTANAPSASAPAAAPGGDAKDAAAPAGASVRDGKFEFTVQSVTGGAKEVGDNPYLKQTAQGQFFVVTVKVTNIGDKPQSFSPSNQKLIDNQGREFEPDATAQIALGGSDIPVWDNINPGNTADVKLVYDMPVGAVPAAMELHDSMFSAGAKVNVGS